MSRIAMERLYGNSNHRYNNSYVMAKIYFSTSYSYWSNFHFNLGHPLRKWWEADWQQNSHSFIENCTSTWSKYYIKKLSIAERLAYRSEPTIVKRLHYYCLSLSHMYVSVTVTTEEVHTIFSNNYFRKLWERWNIIHAMKLYKFYKNKITI